jgi:hypothetical protein
MHNGVTIAVEIAEGEDCSVTQIVRIVMANAI